MSFQKTLIVVTLTLAGASAAVTWGQLRTTAEATKRLDRVPALFQRQLAALGARMTISGKEQTTYLGVLVDAAGNRSAAKVIYQIPDLVRLEGFKPRQEVLSFDGERAAGVLSRDDESLLETFLTDIPEGMLASIKASAGVRVLGLGFGPDPRTTPQYTGPRFDIFEITGPVRSRSDQWIRTKLYYFDSETGLLQSTRFYDRSRPSPAKLETRFPEWRFIEGSAYPARIDRYEDGRLLFSFIATTITSAPPAEAAEFR